ncbi:unnamed protein product [Caenorhabditis auriculariae]|uniref:Vesicle transport protein n=1 Tax=Caenorhabditis auriculariae TaxID=2777116 RepID=A0A8S1GT59_9PELO|nr:unnamed protein product [Caenorhabditis auriculariae]
MFGSMHRSDDTSQLPTSTSDPGLRNIDMNGPPIATASSNTSVTSLSWELRVQAFSGLFILSIISSLCGSYLMVLMKITGFCIMTSISAVLSLASTCFLMGPVGQCKKMFHRSRWIASSLYLLMIVLTLFAGLALKNVSLAIICTAGQYVAMAWYSLSYIPYAREAVKRIFC